MRRGSLEYCVLALLQRQPRYAIEVVQILAAVPGMLTTEGTVYPLMSRLRKERMVDTSWVESSNGSPRRYYRLTPKGTEAIARFTDEWQTFKTGIDQILEESVP